MYPIVYFVYHGFLYNISLVYSTTSNTISCLLFVIQWLMVHSLICYNLGKISVARILGCFCLYCVYGKITGKPLVSEVICFMTSESCSVRDEKRSYIFIRGFLTVASIVLSDVISEGYHQDHALTGWNLINHKSRSVFVYSILIEIFF